MSVFSPRHPFFGVLQRAEIGLKGIFFLACIATMQSCMHAQAPAQGSSVVPLVLTEEALSKLSLPRKAQQLPGVILLPNGHEVNT